MKLNLYKKEEMQRDNIMDPISSEDSKMFFPFEDKNSIFSSDKLLWNRQDKQVKTGKFTFLARNENEGIYCVGRGSINDKLCLEGDYEISWHRDEDNKLFHFQKCVYSNDHLRYTVFISIVNETQLKLEHRTTEFNIHGKYIVERHDPESKHIDLVEYLSSRYFDHEYKYTLFT